MATVQFLQSTSGNTTNRLFGLPRMCAKDEVIKNIAGLVKVDSSINPELLRATLNGFEDSARCLASPLLRVLYSELRANFHKIERRAKELLKDVYGLNLSQEEQLFFFYRCLVEEECPVAMLKMACELQPWVLKLHMDFTHRPMHIFDRQPGFPVQCVVRNVKGKQREEECLQKIKVLLDAKADADACWTRNDESAVHEAARLETWRVVRLLLDYGVNIDMEINGVSARQLITRSHSEWVINYPVVQPAPVTAWEDLYREISEGNEQNAISLLEAHQEIEVDKHDGRNTLVQLAVARRFKDLLANLIEKRKADINLCAGNCTHALIMAFGDEDLVCLPVIACHRKKLNLRFECEGGTVLNALALNCTHNSNAKHHGLHFYGIIDETINQNIHISAKDKYRSTALEVLGFQSHRDSTLFRLLLERGGFLTLDENLVLQIRPEIFTEFFDSQIRFVEDYKSTGDPVPEHKKTEIIEINYRFLEPLEVRNSPTDDIEVSEMLPFFEICKSEEHKQILLHPIIAIFLIYKWRKIAFVYLLNLLLYLCFTVLYSIYIQNLLSYIGNISDATNATDTEMSSNWTGSASNSTNKADAEISSNGTLHSESPILVSLTMFFWCLLLFRELFQVIISPARYIHNWENVIEALLLIFSMLTFISTLYVHRFIVAFAIALTYGELTLLIGRHPSTATYVTMFMRISFKSFQLILLFSSFFFAFAFGFHVFFHEIGGDNLFDDLWHATLRTSGMAVGEFNVDDLKFENNITRELMFLIFLIFVPIVLMNLLNALAVTDTQKVIDETTVLCTLSNIKHYTQIESMWLGYSLENAAERCYGFPTSKGNNFVSFIRSLININFLPIPENPYTNPEPTCFFSYHLVKKHYYPSMYFSYEDKPTKFSHYTMHKSPKSCWQFVKHLYNRILLRGSEDWVVRELRNKIKFPNLDTSVSEDLEDLRKKLKNDLRTKHKDLTSRLSEMLEKNQNLQSSALATLDAGVSNIVKGQSSRVVNNLKEMLEANKLAHDTAFSNLTREVHKIAQDLKDQQTKLAQENDEIKKSMMNLSKDLTLIKELLMRKSVT